MRGLLVWTLVGVLTGCVSVPVGEPIPETELGPGQRALVVGVMPGLGGAWYAGRSVTSGEELTFRIGLAEAVFWPMGVVLVNGVFLLYPTVRAWWAFRSEGWDPPYYYDRNEVCEFALIGVCRTTNPPRRPPIPRRP